MTAVRSAMDGWRKLEPSVICFVMLAGVLTYARGTARLRLALVLRYDSGMVSGAPRRLVPLFALAACLVAAARCPLFEPSDELYIEAGKRFVAEGCCSYAQDRPRAIGCHRCPVLVDAKVTEATVDGNMTFHDDYKMVRLVTEGTVDSVLVEGKEVVVESSTVPMSSGDEPGTAGGVVSGVFRRPASFKSASAKVFAKGKKVVIHTAVVGHNGQNANMPAGMHVTASQGKVLAGA